MVLSYPASFMDGPISEFSEEAAVHSVAEYESSVDMDRTMS